MGPYALWAYMGLYRLMCMPISKVFKALNKQDAISGASNKPWESMHNISIRLTKYVSEAYWNMCLAMMTSINRNNQWEHRVHGFFIIAQVKRLLTKQGSGIVAEVSHPFE